DAAGGGELVGVVVAGGVVLLAGHDEDVRGRPAEPVPGTLLLLPAGERLDRLAIVDDAEAERLAVARVRAASCGARDPLQRLARHRLAGVAAHGAPPLQQLVERLPL